MNMIGYWVASGDFKWWYQSLDYMKRQGKEKQIVWAVTEDVGKRAKEIKNDDIVAFWAREPVMAIIGFGRVNKVAPQRNYPIFSGDEESLEKSGKVYSPFTIEMEILWLGPPYPWLCRERNKWIHPGHTQAGLNRVVEPKHIEKFKQLFNLTTAYQELLDRL